MQALEGLRKISDMGGIMIDEVVGEARQVFEGRRAAFDLQSALDQLARAGADHVARGL